MKSSIKIYFLSIIFKFFSNTHSTHLLEKFSIKQQLELESKYHPSLLMRILLKYILKKLSIGDDSIFFLSWLGISSSIKLTVRQLYHLISLLSKSHPINLPFASLGKIIILNIFPFFFNIKSHLELFLLITFFLLLLFIIEEAYWFKIKNRSLMMLIWSYQNYSNCRLINGVPCPNFLTEYREKNLWNQCFQISKDLKLASEHYLNYSSFHAERLAKNRRIYLSFLCDFIFFIEFILMFNDSLTRAVSGALSL